MHARRAEEGTGVRDREREKKKEEKETFRVVVIVLSFRSLLSPLRLDASRSCGAAYTLPSHCHLHFLLSACGTPERTGGAKETSSITVACSSWPAHRPLRRPDDMPRETRTQQLRRAALQKRQAAAAAKQAANWQE